MCEETGVSDDMLSESLFNFLSELLMEATVPMLSVVADNGDKKVDFQLVLSSYTYTYRNILLLNK